MTPMTTVTGSGANHFVELGLPAPFSMEMGSAFAGVPPLEEVVLAEEVEDDALVAPTVPDPATTTMVPTIKG